MHCTRMLKKSFIDKLIVLSTCESVKWEHIASNIDANVCKIGY
jgi:hypothetical protein